MKSKNITWVGKLLMKIQPIRICIIDDVDSYFNKTMLNLAGADGNLIFERWNKIGELELKNLVQSPRDIVILDIKGIVDREIGKDGFDIAKYLHENTPSYIVTTSAHKFKLKNRSYYGDYVLAERLLTPLDFIDELNFIIGDYLETRLKPYRKLLFKVGLKLAQKKLTGN